MPRIDGIDSLLNKLSQRQRDAAKDHDTTIITGFTANYALYVHEKMGMVLAGQPRRGGTGKGFYWDPQGTAGPKYLEGPAKELKPEFARMVRQMVSNGATLRQALLTVGLRLQREAQLRVPVDTGNLKGSAFTREEK